MVSAGLRTASYAAFLLFLAYIAALSIRQASGAYLFESIFFAVVATAFFRKELGVGMFFYGCLLLAMTIHTLGIFGFYALSLEGVHYDALTHAFGSFAIAGVVYSLLRKRIVVKGRLDTTLFFSAVFLASLGVAVLGEFVEFSGMVFLNSGGHGLLGVEPDPAHFGLSREYYDTMTDLLFNAAGSVVALVWIGARMRVS